MDTTVFAPIGLDEPIEVLDSDEVDDCGFAFDKGMQV